MILNKQNRKMTKNWSIDSWRSLPIKQQPEYQNLTELSIVEEKLASFPPLVSVDEVEGLKKELALVSQGKAFLLQGGDCAESFGEFNHNNIRSYFKTILQMTIALMYGAKKPIVKVGRISGQYAKPRSTDFETIDGVTLPSYKGDNINSIEFTPEARVCDPYKLIDGYFYSATTLNYIRSLALGGFSSLKNINRWNENFAHSLNSGKNIEELIAKIDHSIAFMKACGVSLDDTLQLNSAKFYTSHEALLLNYEQAFTRNNHSNQNPGYYGLSAHMLWIGDRTRDPKEAHVEYMRGINNPIAFKVGPSITKEALLELLDILNPQNEAGRITLIARMGADKVGNLLPPLVDLIKKEGRNVVWSCDPMHGNTIKANNGYKTRKFDDILSEIKSFFEIHKAAGTHAGGVHFEMTGQNVTECIGGNQQISETNLQERYHTHCDPRLNSSQSLELAFLISEQLQSILKD